MKLKVDEKKEKRVMKTEVDKFINFLKSDFIEEQDEEFKVIINIENLDDIVRNEGSIKIVSEKSDKKTIIECDDIYNISEEEIEKLEDKDIVEVYKVEKYNLNDIL